MSVKPNGEIALNKRPIQLSELEIGVRTLVQANQQAIVLMTSAPLTH
ncbi:MAG: hypothetical protein KME10_16960 [Plectolyngbya sp. WJT66-NPBG17]|nr:hypothetical protein [Plectolyngbya sp. WJT66-NPBG17]MBW4525974.1 hypothetical protein [Phormidium tanganyikae FI6-MK23]